LITVVVRIDDTPGKCEHYERNVFLQNMLATIIGTPRIFVCLAH